jgi:hypothetical protein
LNIMPTALTTSDRDRPSPRRLGEGGLWLLTVAPTVWAAHLLLSYITAAIWCAKFAGPAGSLNGIPQAIAWYTAIALAAIVIVGWEGWRRHQYPRGPSDPKPSGTETTTHDLDSREDRHRFLGFATLLLSGLSAVGVLYAAMAATFFDTCR